MFGFGRRVVIEPLSRKRGVTLILVAKLSLIVGVLLLLQIGAGYLDTATWVVVLHGIVLTAVMALIFWGRARHKDLVGGGAAHVGGKASGIILHGAAGYDLLAKVLTFGREGRFREFMLRPARL